MKALIENADNLHTHGLGERYIIDGKNYAILVRIVDGGKTAVEVFNLDTQKMIDKITYPFFLANLSSGVKLARRRLILAIVKYEGGSASDIAYATNKLQQAELEIFPQYYIKQE